VTPGEGTAVRGHLDGRGVALAVGAYGIWGLFPAYWPRLDPAAPVEVLAHRILWTLVLMAGVLTMQHTWSQLRTGSREWLMLAAAAGLIAVNWGTFIYAVAIGRVVEIALGFYMNPLISVLLGLLVLRERLRPAQWCALGIAGAAVAVLVAENGRVPVVAFVLAGSFGLYALLKKTVPVPPAASLTAEGIVLAPLAVGFLAWLEITGRGTLTGHGAGHVLWLISAGPVTAVPLLLFTAAARRIPLSVLGVLQYLTPTMHFVYGVLVLGEPMSANRWAGFALVWAALVIFTVDLVRESRRGLSAAEAAEISTGEAH
jgi:chloramphenicol-sensitive protein RarD